LMNRKIAIHLVVLLAVVFEGERECSIIPIEFHRVSPPVIDIRINNAI
jgi:hypothetical protein